MTIKNLKGESIEVTHLQDAKDECLRCLHFAEESENNSLINHWQHMVDELNKLKEPEPKAELVEVFIDGVILSQHVRETRQMYGDDKTCKMFTKNEKTSPLYGIHSCARAYTIMNRINNLKIGESTYNGGYKLITRIY